MDYSNFDKNEELLTELSNRFVLFPIKYNAIWGMYKKAESAFWTAEEIDLSKDMDDWVKLNEKEQHFIKNILAFFAGSDGIVNENLGVRFMNDVQAPEARAFYGFQIAMENIHCVTYDTGILTKQGYLRIGSVAGKVQEVWNGESFQNVMVMKTSNSAPVMTVSLSNGMELTCTPTHKWLIKDQKDSDRIPTSELTVGMELQDFEYPVLELEDGEIFSNPRVHGISCNEPETSYSPVKHNCRPYLFVPVNFSVKTKVDWLSGVLSKVTTDKNGIKYSHTDRQFLKDLQLLLTTMNVESSLETSSLTLTISPTPNGLVQLFSLGLNLEYDEKDLILIDENKKAPLTVTSITSHEEKVPTFCFEEPIKHSGVFNGILTGNSETYALLVQTYIKDTAERAHLLNAINTIPCIKKKAEWAMKWISDEKAPFAMRLVAFAVVEGLFFSGAFCSIFWLKERGLMPGLTLSNEFISRDESLHTEFAILLYSMLQNKLSQEVIHDIFAEAVQIEEEFINESIPCNLLGMNSELMSQYIKFVGDRLLLQLGYDKLYNCQNPFAFMDRISLNQKTNFFEFKSNSEYAKAGVGVDQSKQNFSLDEEF